MSSIQNPISTIPIFFADANETSIRAEALAASNAGGGFVYLPSATIALTQPLPAYENVVYVGVWPGLDIRTNTNPTQGTIFTNAGTCNGYEWNPSDLAIPPISIDTFIDGMLKGAGLVGIQFDGFIYGVKIGGKYNPGAQGFYYDKLTCVNCTEWGFWLENYEDCQGNFGVFKNNTVGQRGLKSTGVAIFNAGNSKWDHELVEPGSITAKVAVSWAEFNSSLNDDVFISPQLGDSGYAEVVQVATMVNASANIGVTDSSQFPVGTPVTVSASVNGFVANQIYFVKTAAANVVTLANTTYGAAIVATGNSAVNLKFFGQAHFEFAGLDAGSFVTSHNVISVDTEGTCSCRILLQNDVDFVLNPGGFIGASAGVNEYATFCMRGSNRPTIINPRQFSVDADATAIASNPWLVGNTNSTISIIPNKQTFNGGMSIGSGQALDFAGQAFFYCDGANSATMRNGANPQILNVANEYTGAVSYEFGLFGWNNSDQLLIGTVKGSGGGASRPVLFTYGGTVVGDIGDSSPNELTWGYTINAPKFATGNNGGPPATIDFGGDRYYSHVTNASAFAMNAPVAEYGLMGQLGATDVWALASSVGGITLDHIALRWDRFQNCVLGPTAALATNATNGFAYIPTCAGPPTGVPTAFTGKVAMVYDTVNNKFYIYNGGWKGGTNPGVFV